VLGRSGRLRVAHAHDRRHPARQVGAQAVEQRRQLALRPRGRDVEPDGAGPEADRLDGAFQLGGVRAAPEARVQAGAVEDGALVGRVSQPGQRHRDARLAAEVGLLADVGHALDQQPVGEGGRRPGGRGRRKRDNDAAVHEPSRAQPSPPPGADTPEASGFPTDTP